MGWQGKLDLEKGWENFGGEFQEATYSVANGICYLQGLVKADPIQHGSTIAILPYGCRPSGRIILVTSNHNLGPGGSSLRVDILASGEILFVGGDILYNWISLSGLSFIVVV